MTEEQSKTRSELLAELNAARAQIAALKEDESRYRNLVETTSEWIWETDSNEKFIYSSPQSEQILGYRVDEILGLDSSAILAPGETERLSRKFTEYTRAKSGFRNLHCRCLHKNGRIVVTETNAVAAFDESGAYLGHRGVSRDVSERYFSEKALRESESRFRMLFDNAPLPYQSLDAKGRLLEVNLAWLQSLGFARHEVVGRAFQEFLSPESRSLFAIRFPLFKHLGVIDNIEYALLRKDGSHMYISLSGRVQSDSEGNFVRSHCIFLNVTERKHAEQALRSSKETAEAASRAKSEFLANMSHEVRTPLNGVLGMLQLMSETELCQEQREYLELAVQSGRNLLGVINDILDLSKIEVGQLTISMAQLDPVDLVAGICSIFSLELKSRGLELIQEYEPDLPCRILGDAARIRQILLNLIGNSVKFTKRGSIRVKLGRPEEPGFLRFEVTDSGIGIDNSLLAAIFEPFVQVDGSLTRGYQGLGLGLSIVKRLIGLMQGKIKVESEVGRGTTMIFELPLVLPEKTTCPEPNEQSKPCPINRTVLLVEDDRTNQLTVGGMLKKRGMKVIFADNGQEALDTLLKRKVDAVLMDVQMPGMNGMQATMAIRDKQRFKDLSKLPIIALTAHAMEGDKEKFLASGMNDYLAKPVDIESLMHVLGKHLG